jgi:hypothetical protein
MLIGQQLLAVRVVGVVVAAVALSALAIDVEYPSQNATVHPQADANSAKHT